MEKADKTTAQLAKEKKLKIALSVTAILLILVIAWLLILKNTGAWLLDKGEWNNARYTLGYIDYTYEINDSVVDISSDTNLTATVPLIGGVKLNDQSADTAASSYEKYAEQNFNEGITVVHIRIENQSTFPITMNYKLDFNDMFDGSASQDLFYLILPRGAVVNPDNKTVQTTQGGSPVGYKEYVKNIIGENRTYEQMRTALSDYYQQEGNKELKNSSIAMAQKGDALELDILFWSEYNDNLPFVTGQGEEERLMPAATEPSKLEGTFTLTINCAQSGNTET